VVLVEGNDRSFLTDRGANQNLDISQIPDQLFQDLVYISGYSLLSLDQKAIKGLIAKAHDHGALVACDPGSAGFIQDFGIKKFLDALEGVDILLPNLEEGRLLSGEDRPEVITAFLAERFSLVALTMGNEGCAIQGKDQFLQLAAPKAEVVDSIGAGDAFAAAFLKSYLETKDLEAAGKAGIRQGAIAVTLRGGRP
jgi:sugar/nucleoside kinase (ribokinase family)